MYADPVYSRNFLLKLRDHEMCVEKSQLLKDIDLTQTVLKQPRKRSNRPSDREWQRAPEPKPIVRGENAWVAVGGEKLRSDVEKMRTILNKLSDENKDKLIQEASKLKYTSPEIVQEIFQKAVAEMFFSEVYSELCFKLPNIHQQLVELCEFEFFKEPSKELAKFIGELYKMHIIKHLHRYVTFLVDKKEYLDILAELILTVGPQHEMFSDIIDDLYEDRDSYSMKHKFLIMNLNDYKNGVHVYKPKKAKKTPLLF